MRPLTEEESKTVIEKLTKYIGRNISKLVDRPDEPFVFRLHKDRVYYVKQSLARKAENIPRDSLISLGACFGKFTKSGKFRLHVTALDYLAVLANHRIWVKQSAEMSYLYGNNILKSHMSKMSEDVPEHEGIIVMNMSELPLGFAVSAKSSTGCAALDPLGIACFHQTDVGEYLRDEDSLI